VRVLAATPPDCYLDPDWKPEGVVLLPLEADLPDQVNDSSLADADLLLLAGYIPGPTLLRSITRLLERFPPERVAVVAPDASTEFATGMGRLGVLEVWSGLSERRLHGMVAALTSPIAEVDASPAREPAAAPQTRAQGMPGVERLEPDPVADGISEGSFAPLPGAERSAAALTHRQTRARRAPPATQSRAREAAAPGVVVGAMSAKGGDGGSFVAANLATVLTRVTDAPILLIDLALPFGDVEMFLELQKPEYDLADFCEDIGRLDRELFEMMTLQMSSGLHHIPSLRALDRFGAILPERIEELIRRAMTLYRFVILDLGSGISPVALDLMRIVDQLAVVATPTVPSLRKASQVLGIWERIGREPERLLLVGNRMARKWDLSAEEFEEALRQPLAWQLPNVPEVLNQAVMAGLPLVQHAPRSPMTLELTRWAAELAGVVVTPPKESLWQRLMNR
jgi:pilus assembly protein CpaE